MAPAYSAFVDYICVMVSKKYQDSGTLFFRHIFREKPKD